MAITPTQRSEIAEVINTLLNATSPRIKRRLSEIFLELVNKELYPEYYEIIPEPRSLNGVKDSLEKNKYKDPLDVYDDLNLVFLNALYYNEEGSQISKDANALKIILDNEWKQRSVLPTPRTSPPPSSAQRVHKPKPSKSTSTSHAPTPIALAPAPASAPAPIPAPVPSSSTPKLTQARISTPIVPATPKRSTVAPPEPPAGFASPDRPGTPDMDVDVGGTPEPPEGVAHETARDGESDEIVRQLEKGLPRWEGFADVGWAQDITPQRQLELIAALKDYKDQEGHRIAAALESMPEETTISDLSFNFPLSLSLIESKVRDQTYNSSQAFDKEVSQLFLKGRRYYELGSESYGHVLTLQRLYQALHSPSPPPGPPYTSSTYFASNRAGPGTAKPLHATDAEGGVAGVTTFRISTKDRTFVDELQYKGWSIKLADWLHLMNPDDPSRPIIAQVFRCWLSDEISKKGQPGVTVCWYYRPEQTWHPAQRQFWEREVFKTSHFADHPIADLIEKIACQFTARHIRGRPRPPFWYPGWPLYVCDSRYNDRERIFVKIKNWNSCVPEEVRKKEEFMPIYPFERSVYPKRFASLFLNGNQQNLGKVPGGIGDVIEKGEGAKIEGGGTGRKRTRRTAGATGTPGRLEHHTDRVGPSKGVYVGLSNAATPAAHQSQQAQSQQTQYAQARMGGDRSLVNAAGGLATLGGGSVLRERLPSETAKYFDRDPLTNEVLWFAAPPVDIPHPPPGPQYSLAYLHFLAKKHKASNDTDSHERESDRMDIDDESGPSPSKKRRRSTPARRTVAETVKTLLEEHGLADIGASS